VVLKLFCGSGAAHQSWWVIVRVVRRDKINELNNGADDYIHEQPSAPGKMLARFARRQRPSSDSGKTKRLFHPEPLDVGDLAKRKVTVFRPQSELDGHGIFVALPVCEKPAAK